MKTKIVDKLTQALHVAEMIVGATSCPDPAEGGCIGGPLLGYGCVHEGAASIASYLKTVLAEVHTEGECTGHLAHSEYISCPVHDT